MIESPNSGISENEQLKIVQSLSELLRRVGFDPEQNVEIVQTDKGISIRIDSIPYRSALSLFGGDIDSQKHSYVKKALTGFGAQLSRHPNQRVRYLADTDEMRSEKLPKSLLPKNLKKAGKKMVAAETIARSSKGTITVRNSADATHEATFVLEHGDEGTYMLQIETDTIASAVRIFNTTTKIHDEINHKDSQPPKRDKPWYNR